MLLSLAAWHPVNYNNTAYESAPIDLVTLQERYLRSDDGFPFDRRSEFYNRSAMKHRSGEGIARSIERHSSDRFDENCAPSVSHRPCEVSRFYAGNSAASETTATRYSFLINSFLAGEILRRVHVRWPWKMHKVSPPSCLVLI